MNGVVCCSIYLWIFVLSSLGHAKFVDMLNFKIGSEMKSDILKTHINSRRIIKGGSCSEPFLSKRGMWKNQYLIPVCLVSNIRIIDGATVNNLVDFLNCSCFCIFILIVYPQIQINKICMSLIWSKQKFIFQLMTYWCSKLHGLSQWNWLNYFMFSGKIAFC